MASDDYKQLLNALAISTLRLGYAAVHVYGVDELEEAQMGYSVDTFGNSLVDGLRGSWQSNWVVIGYEDECGDPIFIDIQTEGFPVHTAMHGSGSWEPKLIASGLRNFAAAMREMGTVAQRRENPVKLKANPIAHDERARVIDRIQRQNAGIDLTFWETLLG